MADDSRHIDFGWDGLPAYADKSADTDEAVTVSISTMPGEWLVNTNDAVVVPMSMVELVEGLRKHTLNERSLVWRAGMQEWAPVDKVPQLKLAARLPPTPSVAAPAPSVPPPASVAPPRPSAGKPPPKPVRPTPVPPAASAAPAHAPAPLSRKSTLPFGFASPVAAPASQRPPSAKPSQPRMAAVPAPRRDEPEVLAVYARPAATISFDLSPEQPLRAPPAAVPETLAPLTSDTGSRQKPPPRNADLSVVAASQFRQVQRSSKRVLWLSSIASAAAASLLTFWLSHQGSGSASNVAPASAPLAVQAPAALVAPPPSDSSAVTPPALPSNAAASPPAAATSAAAVEAKPKPKAHRRRVVKAVAATSPAAPTDDAGAAPRDPSTEPNPYEAKPDDAASADKPTPAAKPAAPEAGGDKPSEPSAVIGSE